MHLPKINVVYRAVFSGNLLIFACGTAVTWSISQLSKLADPETTPFKVAPTPEQLPWMTSLLTLGAAMGPFLFGYMADKFGKKPALLYLGAPFVACQPFLAFSANVEAFYVARFLLGLGLGGAFIVMPIYIGEISDKADRGALSTSMSCFACLGILFSCSLGPYVDIAVFNMVLALFPAVFLVAFYRFAPESPHFYVSINDLDSARSVLQQIRVGHETVEKELAEIQACVVDQSQLGMTDIFASKATIRALIISVGLLVFQQFSGINAVIFYSHQIFAQTGTELAPEICTIIVVAVQFLSSFLTPVVVDKFGRKIILLLSAMGMALSEIPLGVYCYLRTLHVDVTAVSLLPVVALAAFIFFFNVGFGPLPWALLSELFPASIKSIATASVSSLIWILAFFATKYFEVMVATVGIGQLFLFFAFCCLLASIFVIFCVVETKGKSLKEVQDLLNA
ncbi:hypothetical protein NQ318_001928 [Aromia moschata]|uniref:Major facilitator superfamily (MFS) profile domain-containing protein n=1 Tax=Aromia moschata TaxID=1265417 RepID=A0AAV8Z460_9CUCU|nr:hypothetical protein NQ318_001928 [Aromia moschata]